MGNVNSEIILGAIGLLVTILGWLAKAVSSLTKTLATMDKNQAVFSDSISHLAEGQRELFNKTDTLEKQVAHIEGKCETIHG